MVPDTDFATLDPETLKDVARLVVAELKPEASPKHRSKSRHAADPQARRGTETEKQSAVMEVKSSRTTATVTKHNLSKAIETALRKIIGEGDIVVFRGGSFTADPGMRKLVERLPAIVEARRQLLTERHIEALVDAYLPAGALAPVMPDIEADNARAQARFLQHYPTLTADEVAQRAGHNAANRSATANRWKAEQKIFAVRAGGRDVYPAFQFKEGRPRPSLQPALSALSGRSGWQIAFWFITPNGWLGGPAPIERLNDGKALAAAAGHEAEAWVG
jgi:hypothetical protein